MSFLFNDFNFMINCVEILKDNFGLVNESLK